MKMTGVLLVLVCATSLSVPGQEGAEGSATSAIRALEREWSEGQSRNDTRALDLMFDNALVYIEYGKLVTKGEYLSRIKSVDTHLNQIVMEPMTVRTFGTTAVVVGTYREKDLKAGKHLLKRWRFIDTWVYKNVRWMLVSAGAAPLSM